MAAEQEMMSRPSGKLSRSVVRRRARAREVDLNESIANDAAAAAARAWARGRVQPAPTPCCHHSTPWGLAVKSHPSKNDEPGISSSDCHTACNARKSTGSRIPSATTAATAKNVNDTKPLSHGELRWGPGRRKGTAM